MRNNDEQTFTGKKIEQKIPDRFYKGRRRKKNHEEWES